MKLEQLLIDHYRQDDFIEVQCLWLQSKMKEIARKDAELEATKRMLQGQIHKNDRLQAQLVMASMHAPVRLDERV